MQNYLFVHFRETTSPEGEQVYFALSRDGFAWEALNDGQPILWAYYGDKGVRDMTVIRDRDTGRFHIFATDLSLAYGMRNQYAKSWENISLHGSKD
ncbi:MAG: 1,4-beta-xylanase, partial [Clostridiales bacterium]|nr:1,4-beta-xylanase [Clostridiales bacterium]